MSFPETVGLAKQFAEQLLPGEDVDLHLYLVPDKIPPETVVEIYLAQPDELGEGLP